VDFPADIPDRGLRQAERPAGSALEAASRVAAGAAHDINNFLTAILLNADLLASRLTGSRDLQPLAQTILEAAEHAAGLTKRLQAFGCRQGLDLRATDVKALLAGLQPQLRETLGSPNSLALSCGDGPAIARTDAALLQAAMLELAANARDAMPDGGSLAIELSVTDDAVMIAVADTGVGMSEAVAAQAFEPFFTTKETGGGRIAGFGLSSIYGFVVQSGGRVAIRSRPGDGTCVTLHLPRTDEEPGQSRWS
jgi:signal transduction histidine kinase